MFILGASYGSVMGDLETYIENLDLMQAILPAGEGFTLTEQFIPMLMSVISMVSAIPVLLMLLRLAAEERHNRTEPLLARAVSRSRLMGSYLAISVIVSPLLQLLAVMEEPLPLGMLLNAAMVYLPAMWVMIGPAILLIGILPQGTGLTWLYLGYSFFVVYLGSILQVPEWMATLSPFGHIPQLPVEDVDFVRLSVLTLIAMALTVIGFRGYRTRDIQG